ncbi:MAG: DUF2029 domain-containing protein [Anaerolineales bacterium]|nr:DUF2029 domain-containing protein [Anaerolineales bacterium]MCX7607723.1 DUF2029 domain-containing protein [Anaerolineales bacterium]MDW8227967.1 glycosyltransferase family 87 protein [Anaerolineales bacterium]
MSRFLSVVTPVFLILLAVAVVGGMVWGNTLYARQHRGETDFFVPWLAAQTFLRYGDPTSPDRITPYSEAAAQRAQLLYYGRLAEEGESPLYLWLPMPAELFYFPFALIPDYAVARGVWMTLNQIALVASAVVVLKLIRWSLRWFALLLALLFSVLWLFGWQGMLAASPAPLVFLAAMGALWALRAEQEEVAGILFVLPALKWGIFTVFVLFLVWWAFYHRRWRFLAGFAMTIGFLLLVSFLILPGWFFPFLRGLYWHMQTLPPLSLGAVLTDLFPLAGPRFALLSTLLFSLLLFFEGREARQREFRHLLWTSSLTLVVAPLLNLPIGRSDFLAFLFPIFLFLGIVEERWPARGLRNPAILVLVGLLIVSWRLGEAGAILLLSFALLLGLYWVRWYAIRPPRTLLESTA